MSTCCAQTRPDTTDDLAYEHMKLRAQVANQKLQLKMQGLAIERRNKKLARYREIMRALDVALGNCQTQQALQNCIHDILHPPRPERPTNNG